MIKKDIAIASICWARNDEEEKTLRKALEALATLQVPVFITDGGSSEAFISFLKDLPQFTMFAAKGLWAQAKKSITEAGKGGAEMILYTEPDKHEFFSTYLSRMLENSKIEESTGVVLASRSEKGFATFPSFQQMTETTINHCCKEVIGKDVDYCYGPFVFHSSLLSSLTPLQKNCGWGWRPFLFAMAHRLGLSVDAFVGDFECPPDQRQDDANERIYRMKQLTQNIEGLVKATAIRP